MDHDALITLFRRLTLAGAPMLVAGCGALGTGGECPPEQDTTTTVSVASLQQDAAVIDAGSADGGLEDLCGPRVAAQLRADRELQDSNPRTAG